MKLHFSSSEKPVAKEACQRLCRRYGQTEDFRAADVWISIGGDGTTLEVLKTALSFGIPVFGLNYGTLGFLQNPANEEQDLVERVQAAERFKLAALNANVSLVDGSVLRLFAINEVFVFNRRRTQTAHLQVSVNGRVHAPKLEADGLLVCTAVGSSAYNRSAGGSVVALNRDVMIVTPNNQVQRGNLMPPYVFDPCVVDIQVLEPEYRPAGVTADSTEIDRPINFVRVCLDQDRKFQLLFDPGYNLHDRVLRTQGLYL